MEVHEERKRVSPKQRERVSGQQEREREKREKREKSSNESNG